MDYMKLFRALSNRAVYAHRCYTRRAAFVSAAILLGVPLGAQAAVLKINPDDNAGNVINLSGELSASVTHTAEGLVIEIPGVEISLVCDTNTDPDGCTVTIGSGSSSKADTTTTTTTTTDNSSDDTTCDPAQDFLCKDGQARGSDSSSDTADSSDSDSNSDATDSSSSDDTTSGYIKPTTTTSSVDEDDPCSGTGYRKDCVDGVSTTSTLIDFPTGSARIVDNLTGTYNYGSAGQTRSSTIPVKGGHVKVVGLSMDSGTDSGRISYGPVGNIVGVDLRAWVSTTPDGSAVANCAYVGYVEGTLKISTDGSLPCNLSKGGTYYFNMALCKSSRDDLYCSQTGAKAPAADAKVILVTRYGG